MNEKKMVGKRSVLFSRPPIIIGAGSVVNKDIPGGVIAAGTPCKVIRKITEEDEKAMEAMI